MTYFTESELKCKCCGDNKFNDRTLDKLIQLRAALDFPFIISSGYRCPEYNRQIGATQTHATGRAVDIQVSHGKAQELVSNARKYGFTGIGVNQKGAVKSRFIHLDDLPNSASRPRPHIWSY